MRDNGSLYEPFCKTNSNQFYIAYRGPHIWNKIILGNFNFSDEPSYLSFKYKLKETILSLENITEHF